jgi:hypothetical protein
MLMSTHNGTNNTNDPKDQAQQLSAQLAELLRKYGDRTFEIALMKALNDTKPGN